MSKPKNLTDYGAAAEQYASAELHLRGFFISYSVTDKTPYDFIADRDGKLFKIQVKGTFKEEDGRGGYRFTIRNNRGPYTAKEVDFYILYVHPTREFYVIPFAFVTTQTVRVGKKLDQFKNAWHLLK